MEPRQTKLNKWRNKTEAEKHRLAILGAAAGTVLVAIVWATSLINTLGIHNLAAVQTTDGSSASAEYQEPVTPVSPLAQFGQVIGDSVSKLKEQFSAVKNQASSTVSDIISGEGAVYVSTTTEN
jgi:hypothetical protein